MLATRVRDPRTADAIASLGALHGSCTAKGPELDQDYPATKIPYQLRL